MLLTRLVHLTLLAVWRVRVLLLVLHVAVTLRWINHIRGRWSVLTLLLAIWTTTIGDRWQRRATTVLLIPLALWVLARLTFNTLLSLCLGLMGLTGSIFFGLSGALLLLLSCFPLLSNLFELCVCVSTVLQSLMTWQASEESA